MNKFILIPDDLYRSLMSTSETGDLNLDFTKRELDKVKREKVNNSAKNVNVNQELRRYLKFKKDHENKPVLVKLSGEDISNIAAQTAQPLAAINQQLNQLNAPQQQQQIPLPRRIKRRKREHPSTTFGDTEEEEEKFDTAASTPFFEGTPSTSAMVEGGPYKLDRAGKLNLMFQLIKSSPGKFGIEGNTILSNKRTGRAVANSDLMTALDKIIEETEHQIQTGMPAEDLQRKSMVPGMNELYKRIEKDGLASTLLKMKSEKIPSDIFEDLKKALEKRRRMEQTSPYKTPLSTKEKKGGKEKNQKGSGAFKFFPQLWKI